MSWWVLALSVVILPFVAAIGGGLSLRRGTRGDSVARFASAAVGLSFGGSIVLAVYVAADSTITLTPDGTTGVTWNLLAAILAVTVLGLSWMIQAFAVRYLRGDTRQVWFVVSANLLTGFTVVMVVAGSVVVFAVGWVGAGASLIMLLGTYWALPQAREGVRRTTVRFVIADFAFIAAIALLMITSGGDVGFDDLESVVETMHPTQLTTTALLLVISALARSSQIPFQGWLPATLAAPTPVSALMHAGVVNAGAVLLVRFIPVVTQVQAVMLIVFFAGAATMVFASAIRIVKPDVKGRLVFSTMGQMGFMMMACGLGAFAAAIFHLIAHSLYKSALFLGAGMGVRDHAEQRAWPVTPPGRRGRTVAAVVIGVSAPPLALISAQTLIAPDISAASVALLSFVGLTGGVATGALLSRRFTPAMLALALIGSSVLAFGYVAALSLFETSLGIPETTFEAPAWLVLLPAAALVGIFLIVRRTNSISPRFDWVYPRLLAASDPASALVKGETR